MRKLYHPDRDTIQLTAIFAALSDPLRLQLVQDVASAGEQACGAFQYPIAKSTMTHHVRALREAGVLKVRIQGTQHFLSLRRADLEDRFPGLLELVLASDREPLLRHTAAASGEVELQADEAEG